MKGKKKARVAVKVFFFLFSFLFKEKNKDGKKFKEKGNTTYRFEILRSLEILATLWTQIMHSHIMLSQSPRKPQM